MRKTIGCALMAVLFLLTGCGGQIDNRLGWEVSHFSYIDQNGKRLSLEDLKGKIWIADFVFTSCSTVCPPMTANMEKLRKAVAKEDKDVRFISFTVDPEMDTPMKLKQFKAAFTDEREKWSFLTGYTQVEIEQFSRESFKALVKKEEGTDQVNHGTYFYLIDKEGKIVRYYKGNKDVPYKEIIRHIKRLANE
ncbi:SCO family protein [Bacillus sp. 1P06AnD]|uniref:SCO family protein n=1 Tax=Bacillus sp. 1P06AnD TaxID=3132208 RepID=UPI00399F913A